MLKKGDKGNAVRELQLLLGITADGDFGPYTEAVVIKFQKENKLTPDGIAGPVTMSVLSKGGLHADTDRTGFDDSNDTDDKLAYHGEYTTECGLVIDRAYLDSDEYVRDYGKLEPEIFFIHHTAGWNNPYNTINSWNRDKRGRVCTQYCIGGVSIRKGKYGDDKYDGQVVECFPDNYIGWHLGKVGDFDTSKYSSGVEINNFGYAERKGSKFYNYVNIEIPKDMVCDLGYEFRGHRYWHKYTDAQIESLRLLLIHVGETYPKIDILAGIPQLLKDGISPKDAFEFKHDVYYGKEKGVWSHTTVRRDKFDCFPQPELVEMLKNL